MKTTNIEISVADLKTVLPGLAKIVARKSTLPVLGCVKVTLNDDRTLQLQANNLDVIVTARLNNSFKGKPGSLLVPFDELNSIAKRCAASETIELSSADKDTFITYPAAGTPIRKSVEYIGVDQFPPATDVLTEPLKLDDAFKVALSQALECASSDETRYVITGACLDVRGKEAHYVVGTNGHHLLAANSFLFDIPSSAIIPPGKFLTWPGFMEDGPWALRFQPAVKGKTDAESKPPWVRLDSDHWTYVAKAIEGEYPNWKQVVPAAEDSKSQVVLSGAGIKTILDALPLLPGHDEDNQPVTLEITKDDLFLKAKSRQSDWTTIPIPAQVSGRPVAISLNRMYLAKALRFGCTRIEIKDDMSPLLCSMKGKTVVVSPLRPPEAVAPAKQPTPISPNSEKASAEAPSPADQPNQTETERIPMPANMMTAPQRGNLTAHTAENDNSAINEVMTQIDTIKSSLRKVLEDLNETEKLLRKAVKEQKASDKEINKARSALRSLQAVEL